VKVYSLITEALAKKRNMRILWQLPTLDSNRN